MLCDGNCFECKFSDCILDFEDGSLLDLEVETSLQVDAILFKKEFKKEYTFIDVPDYRDYPFIPSEEIPYNPKWKSQAKWREYYRSRARGNCKEKWAVYAREYYKNHRDERLAYGKEYYKNNREKYLEYKREYYRRKKQERNNLPSSDGE